MSDTYFVILFSPSAGIGKPCVAPTTSDKMVVMFDGTRWIGRKYVSPYGYFGEGIIIFFDGSRYITFGAGYSQPE